MFGIGRSQLQQKSGSGQPISESQKFVDALQADFKTLALETKKKYPQIKEVSFKNIISNSAINKYDSCLHYVFTFPNLATEWIGITSTYHLIFL